MNDYLQQDKQEGWRPGLCAFFPKAPSWAGAGGSDPMAGAHWILIVMCSDQGVSSNCFIVPQQHGSKVSWWCISSGEPEDRKAQVGNSWNSIYVAWSQEFCYGSCLVVHFDWALSSFCSILRPLGQISKCLGYLVFQVCPYSGVRVQESWIPSLGLIPVTWASSPKPPRFSKTQASVVKNI